MLWLPVESIGDMNVDGIFRLKHGANVAVLRQTGLAHLPDPWMTSHDRFTLRVLGHNTRPLRRAVSEWLPHVRWLAVLQILPTLCRLELRRYVQIPLVVHVEKKGIPQCCTLYVGVLGLNRCPSVVILSVRLCGLENCHQSLHRHQWVLLRGKI